MTHDPTARLGGKAANLVRLAEAGLPVPRFVVLETDEYRAFVADAGLQPIIDAALAAGDASEAIRAAFAAAPLTPGQRERLRARVAALADVPVAVRSSATAEDLPGLSFAGQQDTFLQVVGVEAILRSVVSCWSSLWTERAIAYRTRNGVDHAGVALAVVVQEMVAAEASGVLFTANPRTGRRDETVIDAVFGLGEALVAGRVTPDTFAVATDSGEVRSRQLAGPRPTLNAAQVRALTALGRRIVVLYGEPQDIEWARVGDEFAILQARPITSLYPVPPPAGPELEVWFSFGAFQGMLEPLTPLGQDTIRMMLSGAPAAVGRRIDWHTNRFVQAAGERLWFQASPFLRTRLSRRLALGLLAFVEPSVGEILSSIADEPPLRPVRALPTRSTVAALARVAARVAPRMPAALVRPVGTRRRLERAADRLLHDVERMLRAAREQPGASARLSASADAMDVMARRFFPDMLPAFAPIMIPSMAMLTRLQRLARRTGLPDADSLALTVLRALPGNVTTEMDLRLADVAAVLRSDAASHGVIAGSAATELARLFADRKLPPVAQGAIAGFLAQYGMRGVGEIDLGAPRWRDDPTPLMNSLTAYLDLADGADPREVHRAGEREAEESIARLAAASPPARARRIRAAAGVIRGLFGARETPKFTIVRLSGLLRVNLDASGRDLVADGRLGRADDIYFLRLDELRRAFDGDWREKVRARRAVWAAEARRGQVPRVLLSDGRAFYQGLGAPSTGGLSGMGVSPGVVEGPVRVVLDARTARLEQGDILVCPGTDPGWTPLFLTAGGLITEVGGLMTHGSVVAREYGIPAVVGVHEATTRLVDGQRIRLDGSSGAIELV